MQNIIKLKKKIERKFKHKFKYIFRANGFCENIDLNYKYCDFKFKCSKCNHELIFYQNHKNKYVILLDDFNGEKYKTIKTCDEIIIKNILE
jgi:hypothetical protein